MCSKTVMLALAVLALAAATPASAAQRADSEYGNSSYGAYLQQLRAQLDPNGVLSERDLLMLKYSQMGNGSSGF
ncbi:MAG: hypothetical protein P4L82_13020 [Ancalomicrobiaceae bacterium]|nr:hypothetical protein [Ancalomicrobiaceae bacterium]